MMALYATEAARLEQEEKKYEFLCLSLYEDWKQGIVTTEEAKRLHTEFKRRLAEIKNAQEKQRAIREEMIAKKNIADTQLQQMQKQAELRVTDRHMLCRMVRRISVYEEKRLEIEFYFTDSYRSAGK